MRRNVKKAARFLLGVAMAILLLLAFASAVRAEYEATIKDNGRLIIKKVEVVKAVDNVPTGMGANDAMALVLGEKNQVPLRVEDKRTSITHSWWFPRITTTTSYMNYEVAYHGGKWNFKPVGSEVEKTGNWKMVFLFFLAPAVLVCVITVINEMLGVGLKRLLFFYVSLFINPVTLIIARALFNDHTSGLFVMTALTGVAFSLLFAGFLAGGRDVGAEFFSLVAVAWSNILIVGNVFGNANSALAKIPFADVVGVYWRFFLLVEIASFILAKATSFAIALIQTFRKVEEPIQTRQ